MDVQPVFATPLIAVTVDDSAGRNAELAAAVLAGAAASSVGREPEAGWRSGRLPRGWGGAAAASLARDAVALAREHSVDTGARDYRFTWRYEMEAILLPPGARTLPAFAPLAFWSVIYCVEDGRDRAADPAEGGAIEFEDPRLPLILMEAPSLRFAPSRDGPVDEPAHRLLPEAGELFMFPGWLRRAHTPDHGRSPRMFFHLDLIAIPHD